MSTIDEMLDRINAYNLERIRASCEADGDQELAALIVAKLAEDASAGCEREPSLRS